MVNPSGSDLSLLVRVRSTLCAIPVGHVAETLRPLAVEPVAGMPHYVRGLSLIRGTPRPVVDLAALFGGDSEEAATRFVVLRVGGRQVALAVDSVVGLRPIDRRQLHPLPPLLGQASPGLMEAVGRLDGELLIALESVRILPDEIWATLEAREGRS